MITYAEIEKVKADLLQLLWTDWRWTNKVDKIIRLRIRFGNTSHQKCSEWLSQRDHSGFGYGWCHFPVQIYSFFSLFIFFN